MQTTYFPLTHAQKRIWYTEQYYPGTSVSNLSGIAKLESVNRIDNRLLTQAIRHVVSLLASIEGQQVDQSASQAKAR